MSLTLIMEKVGELDAIRGRIEQAQTDLAGLVDQEAALSERVIPELLEAEGLEGLALEGGRSLSVSQTIRASVPTLAGIRRERDAERARSMSARREAAIAWLVAAGHDSLLKTEVDVAFGRGEASRASELIQALTEQGFEAELVENINPQTLSALVREQLEAGAEVPTEALAVVVQKKTVIK